MKKKRFKIKPELRNYFGKPAVFLDRDNTLIRDEGYTYKIDDLSWIPGSINGLQSFFSKGFILVVITNQSGVARGYYNEKELKKYIALIYIYHKEKSFFGWCFFFWRIWEFGNFWEF